jgi:hypothetical protein
MLLQPFIGWVDFSEEDQKRARDYLRALEEDTIDELGFGVMRDTLADLFFPATSTIMTYTRYFIFVPVIFLQIEQEQLFGPKAQARLEKLEQQLRSILPIPKRKEVVKRYPASIYWNGLRLLSIFVHSQWSQSYYLAHLPDVYSCRRAIKDDDGNIHVSELASATWDPDLIHLVNNKCTVRLNDKGEFPGDTSLPLTTPEAIYLRTKFLNLAKNTAQSQMSHLLSRTSEAPFEYPWKAHRAPSLADEIDHAEHLSMFAKGAVLCYYVMLVERRREDRITNEDLDIAAAFALWWQVARDKVCKWDFKGFFELMTTKDAVRGNDTKFFEKWITLLQTVDTPQAFLKSPRAQALIRDRESEKRPAKARLRGGRFLEQWKFRGQLSDPEYSDAEHVKYLLNYRAPVASRFICEILDRCDGRATRRVQR